MKNHDFCYLYLTCENEAEASKIARVLLEKRLVVCAKQLSVQASYWWKGKITDSSEIMLIMESRLDLFDAIERVVAKLHTYDTFVLEAVPIARVSKKAEQWMKDDLHA